ncbi:hypothetical protein EYC84_001999 [Monilinia fructicola]|uniref:Uncharacterized protein n=1 Tax=Monilinia fructicola TaxID=38448 RepID=A0A5M9JRE2_MONFR|nr:hypothetical protein EYC84_001999 [Monilinia fructicola]
MLARALYMTDSIWMRWLYSQKTRCWMLSMIKIATASGEAFEWINGNLAIRISLGMSQREYKYRLLRSRRCQLRRGGSRKVTSSQSGR